MDSPKELYDVYYNNNVIDEECKDLIKHWHYSKSSRSMQQKHVFKLVSKTSNRLIGVAIYGNPMSRHYNKQDCLELRRLALIDDTPRNSESFFIGRTLKWLDKNTKYSYIVSFADPNQGHEGTIYKASNFQYDGLEKSGNPRAVQIGDKQVHMRQLYQKKGGVYDERALELQAMVRSGEAEIIKQEKKHRFLYNLRK
jgi:hypothetical protein